MSDTSAAVPSSGGDASAPSSTGDTGQTGSSSSVSAPAGNAPGESVDAGVAGDATAQAAGSPAAQFEILKRRFRDQKHAEEVLGSEIGMTRGLQRKLAEIEKRNQALEAALSMREAGVQVGVQGQGQGPLQPRTAPADQKTFEQELIENGELDLIESMLNDPNMGPKHAFYRMFQLFGEKINQVKSEASKDFASRFEARESRDMKAQTTVNALKAAKALVAEFPELDPDNKSEEVADVQQELFRLLDATPRVPIQQEDGRTVEVPTGAIWLAQQPDQAWRWAVNEYRRTHGTPMFATPPGTSGSPSARAAAAAEAMGNASASALDGSGVPRQRANGQPESPIERLRRENREIQTRVAKTPSGRPLGFEA